MDPSCGIGWSQCKPRWPRWTPNSRCSRTHHSASRRTIGAPKPSRALTLSPPPRRICEHSAPAATPAMTQVALPDFSQAAQNDATDNSPPDIATPTPGVAGPTAVVITSSPWQVIVAPRTVPDLESPSGVAADGEGNFYVVD